MAEAMSIQRASICVVQNVPGIGAGFVKDLVLRMPAQPGIATNARNWRRSWRKRRWRWLVAARAL
eukprot:2228106-Alexandrium_andersonii.AAC.1